MKVYLMYRKRDFDLERKLPKNLEILMHDLEIKTLLNAMSKEDDFLYEVSKQAIFSNLKSTEEIAYRQDILKDSLGNQDVIKSLYELTTKALEKKQERWLGVFGRYPSSLLSSSVSLLKMYFELLKDMRKIVDENSQKFNSTGFKRFFSMVQKELSDEYLDIANEHLKELKFKDGILISAKLGESNEGENYILRRDKSAGKSWIKRLLSKKQKKYTHSLHPRDDAGAKVLRNLRDEGLNLIAQTLSSSASSVDNFFKSLRKELAFYIGCLNLDIKLKELGAQTSFPNLFASDNKIFFSKDLYDISLVLTMDKKVVGNDINANQKELIFVTGANQGGKSTFLRSIGLAQMMVQSGMFVPATMLNISLVSGIFTHFKKEEDKSMKSGKFDEELSRMSDIIDEIFPYALVLFNESFASTNEIEGSEIAQQITKALLEKKIRVIFVTHMYKLANSFYKKDMKNIQFLRANREEDGSRDFKMKEAKPLHTSFAKDIYNSIF